MLVLDVFIGLVLIYFLYSLLASIVGELISAWIGMRARMLRQGIDNILNDVKTGAIKNDFFRWVKDIFLVEAENFKYTTAGKFYEEPTIKYLAKPGDQAWYSLRNRKPSYISKENFVITVLNMLSNKGRGISEWDKIKFAVETNALHLDAETHKMFENWVKRSNDTFEDFVVLIQNHFEETMDRVNGWYKRKIGLILFVIGLFLCIAFNVDSIQIAGILAENKNIRTELADYASRIVKEGKLDSAYMSKNDSVVQYEKLLQHRNATLQSIGDVNQILGLDWQFGYDTCTVSLKIRKNPLYFWRLKKEDANTLEQTWQKLKSNYSSYNMLVKNISKANKTEIKDSLDKKQALLQEQQTLLAEISALSNRIYVRIDTLGFANSEKTVFTVKGQHEKCWMGKAAFIASKLSKDPIKLLGILITAFALSLGANFWFDLLKKLVSLRDAGKKPEEETKKQELIKDIKLKGNKVTSQDPVEIAISAFRQYWMGLQGFVAVNKSSDGHQIDLILESLPAEETMLKFKNEVKSKHDVVLNIIPGDKAVLTEGYGYLYNELASFNKGSAAGIFWDSKTNSNCLLTCAHVVNGASKGFFNKTSDRIFIENIHIGNITNLIYSSFMDISIISINTAANEVLKKYNVLEISSVLDTHIINLNKPYRIDVHTIRNGEVHKIPHRIKRFSYDYTFDNNEYMYSMFLLEPTTDSQVMLGDSGSKITYSQIENKTNVACIGIVTGYVNINGKNCPLCINLVEIMNLFNLKSS
jgi:hypothetical protein